jgi:MFS transporter, MHS family, proline/betaine transporter
MTESLLRGAGRERVEKAAMRHSTLAANAQSIRQSTSRSIGAKRRRVVLAATVGNTLEWYDFLVYGLLTVTIAKLFFPTGSELSSSLLSMGRSGLDW